MNRKAIAIDAYVEGHSAVESASMAGLSRSYVLRLVGEAGIVRPVGRPRKAS